MNLTLVRFGYLGECKSSGLLSFFANFRHYETIAGI